MLNTESAAVPSNCCTKFNAIKANIGEISIPPIAGISPRKAFRYGSVIELMLLRTGLLQSRLGNQLSRTRMIKIREYISRVCVRTCKNVAKISMMIVGLCV